MRFGQTIIAETILSFTSAVELTPDPNFSPWGTQDMLGVGIGMVDPRNEIGFYGAYEACFVDEKAHRICDELQGLLVLYLALLNVNTE